MKENLKLKYLEGSSLHSRCNFEKTKETRWCVVKLLIEAMIADIEIIFIDEVAINRFF